MRTSYSAINTYKLCPLKFKYQEIDKIKVPKSKEAAFGSSIHEALRFLFTRNPLYPTLDEVMNFFTQSWLSRSSKIEIKEDEKNVYQKEGLEMLKNFYKKNQPWNFNTVDLESRFEFSIEDSLTKESHAVAGIIDRIDKNSDDEYEIVDYKTAARMPSQETVASDLQMSIYHLGILNRWPHLESRNTKLSFYFLKHNEKISTLKSEQDAIKAKNCLVDVVREILQKQKEDNFPPHPSPLCNWCGYRPICPMWRHLYRDDNKQQTTNNKQQIENIIKEYFDIKNTEQKNKKRIAELQIAIHQYLDEEKMERIFGEDGYITRIIKNAPKYDLEKTREILEPLGKWKEILKVDERMLDKIIAKLPLETQEKFKSAVREIKTTKTLTISKLKSKS